MLRPSFGAGVFLIKQSTMPKRKLNVKADFFESKKKKSSQEVVDSESLKEDGVRGDENERSWKILSWNVAGLRALSKKGAHKSIVSESADLVFLGEIKCTEWPVDLETDFKAYHKTLAVSQEKKGGYAGVGLLSKIKPLKVWKGIGNSAFDTEGRLIIAEFTRFFFIGAYVPNSGRGLVNLEKRGKWEEFFLEKIKDLDEQKPIIYADLANPDSNRNKTAGFTDQERGWFSRLLEAGFKDTYRESSQDTYRELHGDKQEYTFWSYMGNARSKNIGWRLDYYVVSNRVFEKVKSSEILTKVMGSDHAPIVLEIDI
ncbi:exodeoxyribonuclease III [Necator americanus]|uniref:exodeoxyribonuclease III n=1 Tax=Necator americanus TaxID=51031 RepID=W2SVY8_NECAM|nr:exodeoxyribonuclease III [Necator americanus]ETN73708.1 exodeoxyribonuclease III [Necator americanus]